MKYFEYNEKGGLHPVAQGAIASLNIVAGNPSSLHHTGQGARQALETLHRQIRALAQTRDGKVAITGSGSEALITLLLGLGTLNTDSLTGIVCLESAHPVVKQACALVAEALPGVKLEMLQYPEDGATGAFNSAHGGEACVVEAIVARLKHSTNGTTLLAIEPHDYRTGLPLDLSRLGLALRTCDVVWAVDACRSAASSPADLPGWGADGVAFSGKKLGGPAEIGALCMRTGLEVPPIWHGGGQEWGMRPGSQAMHLALLWSAALQATDSDRFGNEKTSGELKGVFAEWVNKAKNISIIKNVWVPGKNTLQNMVALAVEPRAADALASALHRQKYRFSHYWLDQKWLDDGDNGAYDVLQFSWPPWLLAADLETALIELLTQVLRAANGLIESK